MGFTLLLLKTKVPEHANARVLGSHQADAIQNITGYFHSSDSTALASANDSITGAFTGSSGYAKVPTGESILAITILFFDASQVARTSSETRGANVALAPRIIAY